VIARYASELGTLAQKIKAPVDRLEDERVQGWDRISDYALWLTREQGVPEVAKASLPIAASEEFLERAESAAQDEGCVAFGLAQSGVGVVEVGLMRGTSAAAPNPESRTPNPGFMDRLRQVARDLGGSLVVTRCPAALKAQVDVWGPTGDDFEVMRKLKAAWDPKGTLSPGRFVGGL